MWLSPSHAHQEEVIEEVRRPAQESKQEFLAKPQTLEEGRSDLNLEEEIVMVAEAGRTRTNMSAMLSRRFGLRRES
jgi:hypothetical protein